MMLRVQPRWAVVAVVILAFDTAVAETPISTCGSVIWDNYPIGHKPAVDSSHADPGDVDVSQVGDDFMFSGSAYEITAVEWSGGSIGPPGVEPVTEFNLFIYADDGTGTAPTLPERSSAIFSEVLIPFAAVTTTPNAQFRGFYDFSYCLTTPFIAEDGVKYWIAVQAVTDGSAQWALLRSRTTQLSPGRFGFPGIGVPYWTGIVGDRLGADTSFRLRGGPFEPGEVGACCALSGGCLGDADEGGAVDGRDISAFAACAIGGRNCANADMDGSGSVDAGDVAAFVGALLSGECADPQVLCFPDMTDSQCAGVGGDWHGGASCESDPC